MRKFLFGRVGALIDQRAEAVASDIEAGAAARKEGEDFRRQYEDILLSAKTQSKAIVDEARDKATREYDSMMRDAKSHAQAIVEKSRADIAREKQEAYEHVKGSVASLALLAASKVMESNMDSDRNRAIVDAFLSSKEAA
jgi:F-type H+-transporting ATPase subunit b